MREMASNGTLPPDGSGGRASAFLRRTARTAMAAGVLLAPGTAWTASQGAQSYTIGVRDVLEVSVFNQADLSGRYTVETDGAFSYPLIGRVVAAGSTVQELEAALRTRLLDGYFRDPRVTVAVAEYRSRQVFVMGEIRSPGAYPLAADTTLIEILSLAGSLTSQASGVAIVVRANGTPPDHAADEPPLAENGESPPPAANGGAGTPIPADSETIRVNLRDLEGGDLSRNIVLRDGDTVFVPRAETFYVFGEVRSPGSFPIQEGLTVLQALSLAGGANEFAALNRITILRMVEGEQVEIRVKLDDLVQRDDTIRVPVKFF